MKNNKILIALLLVGVVGIIGLTVAYFSSAATVENEFQTTEYGTTYIEKFTSPTGWLPGDEVEKTLEVRNSGDVDEAVRVKVEEKWVSSKNTELPLKQGNNVAALVNFINGNDWTKVEVDGEDYYYYYYKYKLEPNEITSKLLDKVTFNPLIDASTTCTETIENGVRTRTCNSNGAGYDGATYTLKFTVETVQYNKYKEAWETGNTITLLGDKPRPASEFLTLKATNATGAEYNETTKGKMFTLTHNGITEKRYLGDAPNNYVKFNCDNDGKNCEIWRIIGVFEVEKEVSDGENSEQTKIVKEQRIKLIRGSVFPSKMVWNNESSNDWSSSSLKAYLNGDYYNNLGDALSGGYGLKDSARELIDDAIFYLGSITEAPSVVFGSTEKIYGEERGGLACGACNNDNSKLTWQGKVGLMYPSDEYMVYANNVNSTCYANPFNCVESSGWIHQSSYLDNNTSNIIELLSPYNTASANIMTQGYNGRLGHSVVTHTSLVPRPVVYLASNVRIAGGTGEVGNEYILDKMQ